MQVYLIRHAERGNGEKQDTLTKNGVEQAKKAADYFVKLRKEGVKFETIYASSKKRALLTAKPIAESLGLPILMDSALDEHRLGKLEGKSASEWRNALNKSGLSEEDFRPDSGENKKDFHERVNTFWNKFDDKRGDIILVTHAGFIRNSLLLLFKEENQKANNPIINPCSIVKIYIKNRKAKYLGIDEID